ncbi:glutathione peroxidase [bacterium E08(2017)]|nr:glutathione peroxidase [bacterium E08(2017)]
MLTVNLTMKRVFIIFAFLLTINILYGDEAMQGIHQFKANDIKGNEVDLSEYKGKAVLIVNVASKCGFTGQYEELQKLYTEYKDKGFVILGFPSNDFMKQEPGTDEEIAQFCSTTYGVTFPMFSKIKVQGRNKHPLYEYLTSKDENPDHGGKITWNFNKFLVGTDGMVVERFGSKTTPMDKELIKALKISLP